MYIFHVRCDYSADKRDGWEKYISNIEHFDHSADEWLRRISVVDFTASSNI